MELTENQLKQALQIVEKIIIKCEAMHPKFKVGTSQFTLLTNRLHALQISRLLLERKIKNDGTSILREFEDLKASLPPIISIINKCSKAQSKYEPNSKQYNRYVPLLDTMKICKELIEKEMEDIQ